MLNRLSKFCIKLLNGLSNFGVYGLQRGGNACGKAMPRRLGRGLTGCSCDGQVVLAIRAFSGNPNDGYTIEPLIGHLKSDCRMERNYLWEEVSSTTNAHLSGADWNLKSI